MASSSTSNGNRPASPAPSRARATATAVRSDSASWAIRAVGLDVIAERAEGAPRRGPVVAAPHGGERAKRSTHPEVVRDSHRLDETEVLVDEPQPGLQRSRR